MYQNNIDRSTEKLINRVDIHQNIYQKYHPSILKSNQENIIYYFCDGRGIRSKSARLHKN